MNLGSVFVAGDVLEFVMAFGKMPLFLLECDIL